MKSITLPEGDWSKNKSVHDALPIALLRKLRGNKLGASDIEALKLQMKGSGLSEAILVAVDTSRSLASVLDGNHSVEALRQMGYTHAPVRIVKATLSLARNVDAPNAHRIQLADDYDASDYPTATSLGIEGAVEIQGTAELGKDKISVIKTIDYVPDKLWQKPYDQNQRDSLRDRGFTADSTTPIHLASLRDMLLCRGGWAACVPTFEEDLRKIRERATLRLGRGSKIIKGTVSRCHENVSVLWRENSDKYAIATGYALSKDGIWRQHSWAIEQSTDTIVETTVKRVAYFGFLMTPNECADFAYDNLS